MFPGMDAASNPRPSIWRHALRDVASASELSAADAWGGERHFVQHFHVANALSWPFGTSATACASLRDGTMKNDRATPFRR